MPTVSNPNLTLTTSEGTVTVRVRCDATFSPFERQLAGLGMRYHSHVTVHGIDGLDEAVGPTIVSFPNVTFPVNAGSTEVVFPPDQSQNVARGDLQEDPGSDTDELKCKIRIHSLGMPPEFTADAFTDREVLLG